jgi:argininosuccinate lyase
MSNKLWGGRFEKGPDQQAFDLNASISIDARMVLQDVKGSIAWANATHQAGWLDDSAHQNIIKGLILIQEEFSNESFQFKPQDEDIHTAVERRLYEIIGADAGKLHIGRSRNDQVVTDFKLWLSDNIPALIAAIQSLQSAFVHRGDKDLGVIMPGYTHLQPAQPILISHFWLAHFWALQRDVEKFNFYHSQLSQCPLGAAALAGTTVPVDRHAIAQALGFQTITANSLDSVSNRDYAADFLYYASMLAIHLSKLAEQIILFSTYEFGFITLADEFTTGSSLMPQKKNPDIFELTRGKSGETIGALTNILITLKGLPSTYDKDLQGDKLPVFTTFDTLLLTLNVVAKAITTLTIHPQKMLASLSPEMMATDLADYLVLKGIPFREAHELVGKVVLQAQTQNCSIADLTLADYQAISASYKEDLYDWLSPQKSVERRTVPGGTATQSVQQQLEQAKQLLKQTGD